MDDSAGPDVPHSADVYVTNLEDGTVHGEMSVTVRVHHAIRPTSSTASVSPLVDCFLLQR